MSKWFAISGLLLAGGCTANWYMNGSQLQEGAPASPEAVYRAPTCTMTASGSAAEGPADQTYYRTTENGGPVLYELDASGNGARITNLWVDEAGATHFFTYVDIGVAYQLASSPTGFEYVFPAGDAAPTRLVYIQGTYTPAETDGVIRVTGQPTATCPLVPVE